VIPRLVPGTSSTRFQNLVVGGCSFTASDFGDTDFYWQTLLKCYDDVKDSSWPHITPNTWHKIPQRLRQECAENFDWQHLTCLTWPVYTRDLLNISTVYDFSCSGAGNYHISNSVMYGLESVKKIVPADTLVVIMWSGWDRDDFLVDTDCIRTNNKSYHYDETTSLCYSGGLLGCSNSLLSIENIKKIKSYHSRCIENYLYIVALKNYLENRGFEYYFTSFASGTRAHGFDIEAHCDFDLGDLFDIKPFLGDFAVDTVDGFHPKAQCHHRWSETILIPQILSNDFFE
jgi:hypothetical protein